jgi:Na+/alanine symporter
MRIHTALPGTALKNNNPLYYIKKSLNISLLPFVFSLIRQYELSFRLIISTYQKNIVSRNYLNLGNFSLQVF